MNTSQDATVLVRVLLLALLGLLWSELARAHAQSEAPAQAPTQYVWTGVRDGEQRVKPGELAGYAAQLERDLAKLQVAREVDGPAVDLRGGLREVWVRAALVNEYPRRWEVLAKIAVARAAEFERRGESAVARTALDELLLSAAVRAELAGENLKFELQPASMELVRAAAAVATPELVAQRARLDADARGAARGVRGSAQVVRSLEEAVDRALAEEQPSLVVDLGARAAPALEALVRADLDALPSKASLDPLVLLFRVDETRGAAFALEHWTRGRLLWRKRVLRAMGEAAVLTNPGTWLLDVPANQANTRTPPTLVDTGWRELLGRAVKDEDVGLDSFEEIAKLATYDALDAPLQMGLVAKIERGGPAAWRAARRLLEEGRCRESLRPVLERALNNREPEVRVGAAGELSHFARDEFLLREFASPLAGVRAAVARSIARQFPAVFYNRLVDGSAQPIFVNADRPPLDPGDRAMVEGLMGDPEDQARLAALEAFLRSPSLVVDVDRLLALARDPSVGVRQQLARWGRAETVPPAVLEALAADPDHNVLESARSRLSNLIRRTPDGRTLSDGELRLAEVPWRWSHEYVPALVAWLSNPASESIGLSPETCVAACRQPDGVAALVRAALGQGAMAAVRVASALAHDPARTAWSGLSLDDAGALLRRSWSAGTGSSTSDLARALPRKYWAALREVLLDESAPIELRALCAGASAATADAAWRAALLDVFVRPGGDNAVKHMDRYAPIPEAEREALLHQLLALPSASDEAVAHFFWRLAERDLMSPSLAVAVLERVVAADTADWHSAGLRALLGVSLTEAEPRTELLERLGARSSCAQDVMAAMGRSQLAAHLPLLERGLLGTLGSESHSDAQVRIAAASALASYLDERAAAILLKGLGATTDKNVRDACFAALDSIRRYEDERERWATRKTSRAAREAAIAELVPMLSDKDATIRAQAARSLGALEAVEHLPALVRLLKDSNGDVRKAAQATIDVLTAPKPVAPTPTEPKRD